jgi:hypothetical protein
MGEIFIFFIIIDRTYKYFHIIRINSKKYFLEGMCQGRGGGAIVLFFYVQTYISIFSYQSKILKKYIFCEGEGQNIYVFLYLLKKLKTNKK